MQNPQTRREQQKRTTKGSSTVAKMFLGKVKPAPAKKPSRRHRHSALYESYMQSAAWAALRDEMIWYADGRCQRCDASEDVVILEVHHLTYERLGHEDPDDLEVLCPQCHVVADVERAAEMQTDLASRRLDGWATKVYGPDWESHPGYAEAEDAFDAWLEARS